MKVAMAIDTMAKRANVLGASYPFVVSDIAVLRRKSRHVGHYAALLFLTPGSVARQTVRASETAEMGELLEEIAEAALANFWGEGGTALSFGYPSKHGRPEAFDQAVVWLAGEDRTGSGPGLPPASPKGWRGRCRCVAPVRRPSSRLSRGTCAMHDSGGDVHQDHRHRPSTLGKLARDGQRPTQPARDSRNDSVGWP